MVEIRSREELEEWLDDKPRDWAQVIAVRAAIRALPFMSSTNDRWLTEYALLPISAVAMAWASRSSSTHDIVPPRATSDKTDPPAAQAAARAAHYASFAARAASTGRAAMFAGDGAEEAMKAAASVAAGTILWDAIMRDCTWLLENQNYADAARILSAQSVWSEQRPPSFDEGWRELQTKLRSIDPTYGVWIEWFDRRIGGSATMFDIKGDDAREENEKILIKFATEADENFWAKGTNFVNTTVQGWLDEARARVVPPEPTATNPEATAAKLLESASPQARIVDGKLDAMPNALFDAPQYSDNLADLPTEMQAFLAVLELSLPSNCSIIIRNCIKGYANELQVRGNRPIINILTGMASAIAAQFWIVDDGDYEQNPETLQVRHPEEWDCGTVDLFRTFFKKHIDLITHFPLNAEREALIASTPIDEVKASGSTLLDPIQTIHDLIAKLNTDGLATDNIVKIIDALAQYARDISGLPPPNLVARTADPVTPKRRFVLNFLGFCLHTYSVIGTTVGLAESKKMAAFLIALNAVIQTFFGFIL